MIKIANPTIRGRNWKRFFHTLASTGACNREQAQAASNILDAVGWRDITGDVSTRVGPTNPTSTQVGTTGLYLYAFGVGDEAQFIYHLPHDYVEGSDIHFHVHWMPSGTDTQPVKWEVKYLYAKGHNQEAFNVATPITFDMQEAPPGTAYQHMVTESDAKTVTGLETDGVIVCGFKRVTNGGVDNANTIFMVTADLHYQSTNQATPNRVPDFYE